MGAALLILAASLCADQPDFDAFFKEFAAKRANIQVLEADIVEYTSQFEEVTNRNGRVVFGKPRRIAPCPNMTLRGKAGIISGAIKVHGAPTPG